MIVLALVLAAPFAPVRAAGGATGAPADRPTDPAPWLAMLRAADGETDAHAIVAALDGLRASATGSPSIADALTKLLDHRSRLYRNRDKLLVLRLRSYVLVTMDALGVQSAAKPFVYEALTQIDDRMRPVEIGAAVRIAGSLGESGHELVPYLLEAMSNPFSEEEFSLTRFDSVYPPEEATTVQLEALRSLGRLCDAGDDDVRRILASLTGGAGARYDPRAVELARRILDERFGSATAGRVAEGHR